MRFRAISGREKRLLVYLGLGLAVAAWKFIPRPWSPALTLETEHYTIASTASREQTEQMGRAAEILYAAYSNLFQTLPTYQRDHPKLRMKLYRDRAEMRRVNPGLGWAEAFYRRPICHAYFSAEEVNPYQWMLHEAVHQLNSDWWTLAHFIFESAEHRGAALELLRAGGDLEDFERLIGPLNRIEPDWHAYVCQIKAGRVGSRARKP